MRSLIGHLQGRWTAALVAICLLVPGGVLSCTTNDVLDLIGSVEAPQGYNQVYSGVQVMPPAPITTMTVREVLAWQREASRTAVSSAAGRYQVIRATLEGQVTRGVVSLDDRFDERTQDRIGRSLLAETGYRSGSTDPAVANRISGVWAALPRVSGPGRGASTYEGVAGNHALLTAESYEAFLACEIGLEDVDRLASLARVAIDIGLGIEQTLEAIKLAAERTADAFKDYALWLLWALFAVQIVMTVGRLLMAGESLETLLTSFVFLLPMVVLLYVIIENFGPVMRWVSLAATGISNDTLGLEDYALPTLVRDRMILFIRNIEAGIAMDKAVLGLVIGFTLLSVLVLAVQVAVILFYYAKSLIVLASTSILLATGALHGTRGIAFAVLSRFLGVFLQLIVLNLLMYLSLDLMKGFSAEAEVIARSSLALSIDVIVLILMISVPMSITRLAVIRGENFA